MRKTFLIIAAICCCITMKAQQVGDTFSDEKGKYVITSINPNEVKLTEIATDQDHKRFNTTTYQGAEYHVTSIGNKCYRLTKYVTIHFDEVRSLDQSAFEGARAEVDLVNCISLTEIPKFAFENTLGDIHLPNSITTILDYAFHGSRLREINVSNVTNLAQRAFLDCSYLESIDLPRLTQLNESVFEGCSKLASVSIPNVTQVGAFAFEGCSNLSSISLPNVTEINTYTFSGCTNLTSVSTPNVTHIGAYAFKSCSNLSSISLSNVTQIGTNAFSECTSLHDIELPQCMETIGLDAFRLTELSSLTMYNTIQTFQDSYRMFANDAQVNVHVVDWANNNVIANNTSFTTPAIHYSYGGNAVTGDYELPAGLTTLGSGALFRCAEVTSITLPASLTQIGSKAFAQCASLTALTCNATMPPVLANINAFDGVDKTIPVTIPDNAETYYAYLHAAGWEDFTNYQVSLTTQQAAAITELNHTAGNNPSQAVQAILANYTSQINSATTEEAIEAALQAGIEAIIAQIYNERGVVKIGNLYYILNAENHTATVTYGGLEQDGYATAEYTGNVTIPATVTDGEGATYDVTTIGKHAFHNCSGLTGITLPESIARIGDYAFNSCSRIQSVAIPAPFVTVTIGDYAFQSCTALESLTLPNLLSRIGDFGFAGCSALSSILCLATTPCPLGTDAFLDVDKTIPVTVRTSSLASYRNSQWGVFTNFVSDTNLDALKTAARNAILEALGSYTSNSYIVNMALSFSLRIESALTADAVNALRTEGVYAIAYSISAYEEFFGEMGDQCSDCPAVEVVKGSKSIKLYNPEKVEFKKE